MGEESGSCYGCCPHHGRRCVLIDESHFLSQSREDWNLYHVRTVLGEEGETGDMFHDFALIPEPKAAEKNVVGKGWTLLGSIRPCAARMDLAPLLRPFLTNNNNREHKYTYAKHHAHINLAMTKVTVDDTRHERPCSRKNKNRKQKQEENNAIPVEGDGRWQRPTQGMPLFSRGNATNQQQQEENVSLKKKHAQA